MQHRLNFGPRALRANRILIIDQRGRRLDAVLAEHGLAAFAGARHGFTVGAKIAVALGALLNTAWFVVPFGVASGATESAADGSYVKERGAG
jgi:hypothetical protein